MKHEGSIGPCVFWPISSKPKEHDKEHGQEKTNSFQILFTTPTWVMETILVPIIALVLALVRVLVR